MPWEVSVNTKCGNAEIQAGSKSEKNHQTAEPAAPRIRDLVQRYRVCWNVWPEEWFVHGTKRTIGFAIELCGTHEPGTLHVSPGCEHCRSVQKALKEIANWILPREERPSMYDIDINSQALDYSPAHGNHHYISLTIRITHSGIIERPADECEVRCLQEMEQSLKNLGAFKGPHAPGGAE
jgi:hypothetical protein